MGAGLSAGDDVLSSQADFERAVAEQPLLSGAFDRVFVLADTDRSCLVPAPLSGEVSPTGWLTRHGIVPREDERVVSSPAIAGSVAIALMSGTVCDWLGERYGERIAYAAPLQVNLSKRHTVPTVEMNVGNGRVWLSVCRENVLLAETLPVADTADLLFYLAQLDAALGLRGFSLLLTGMYTPETLQEIARYYPRIAVDRQIERRPGAELVKQSGRLNNVIYMCDADY